MCIVGKTKELAVLQVETVEALAETVGELLAVLDRVKGTGFGLSFRMGCRNDYRYRTIRRHRRTGL